MEMQPHIKMLRSIEEAPVRKSHQRTLELWIYAILPCMLLLVELVPFDGAERMRIGEKILCCSYRTLGAIKEKHQMERQQAILSISLRKTILLEKTQQRKFQT